MSGLWSAFSALGTCHAGLDAILAPGRVPLTFAGLAARIDAIRDELGRLGLGHGDRIVIAASGGADAIVCCLGVMSCAIAVPMNPVLTTGEVRHFFDRIRPKALIVPSNLESATRDVARTLGVATIELASDASAPAGTFTLVGDAAAGGVPRWNEADDVGLMLLTSGTTARSKIVPLTQRQLLVAPKSVGAILGYGPADRMLHLMPLYHGAGLNSSLLVPLINGASVVCLEGFQVSSFYAEFDRYRPTVVSAGPAFLKAILDGVDAHRDAVAGSRLRFFRSGTGRLDPTVLRGLEAAFRAPVLEQYSSSETGAIACQPPPPAHAKRGSVGRPVGVEVAILDAAGAPVGAEQEGEVVVRGPGVFDGYLDDPEANAAAFVDGWFRTDDLGRMDAEGFLTITGRAKQMINRGGEKISPQEVEARLARHAAIRQVKVFGVPHASLDEEVAAAVVLRAGATVTEQALKAFAREELADFKVPRRILFRDALPLLPAGKPDLRRLVEESCALLDARRDSEHAPEHPVSPSAEVVRELWRASLATDRVGVDDDFFLLGGDSLRAAELVESVERALGARLPAGALYDSASTVSRMAAEIERLRTATGTDAAGVATRSTASATIQSARPDPARPLLRPSDLGIALTLAGLAPVTWLLPPGAWPAVCRALGRLHVALRGTRARDMYAALAQLDVPLTAATLEHRALAGLYLDVVMTLREHLPLGWRPAIRLTGVEHLRNARDQRRGAVLWSCPSASGGLVAKRALAEAGFAPVNLRSAIHPYSSTRFGMKILNPVRTRIEDRYRTDTVIIDDDAAVAFEALRAHLRANAIVTIAANGSEGAPFAMPFLGGTLQLSLGAPALAALHDAPLLPLFTVADEKGGYEVLVGAPVEGRGTGNTRERTRALAQGYARILEAHVRRHPAQWRGWFMPNTWRP